MERWQALLLLLMEECDEVSQRASKAIRFTVEEIQEGQNFNNAQRLSYEYNDLVAVIEMLQDENVLPSKLLNREIIELKKQKVEKFLSYSKSLKTIN